MAQRMGELAKERGCNLTLYATQLLEAAFSARIKPDGSDPELEAVVREGLAEAMAARVIEAEKNERAAVARADDLARKLEAASSSAARIQQLETQVANLTRDLAAARAPKAAEKPKGVFVTIEEHQRRLADRDKQIDDGLALREKMREELDKYDVELKGAWGERDAARVLVEDLRDQLARAQADRAGPRVEVERWKDAFARCRRQLDRMATRCAVFKQTARDAMIEGAQTAADVLVDGAADALARLEAMGVGGEPPVRRAPTPREEADALPGGVAKAIKSLAQFSGKPYRQIAADYGIQVETVAILANTRFAK